MIIGYSGDRDMTQSPESCYRLGKGLVTSGKKRKLKGILGKSLRINANSTSLAFASGKFWTLKAKFSFYLIVVSSAGSKTGGCLIFHNKEVAAIKMTVHLFDLVLIYNIRFLDPVKLRWQFFR